MMREVTPIPLTAEAFARFGEVIEASDQAQIMPINYGQTTRFHDLARIDVADEGGHAIASIFRGKPLEPPVLKIVERHPLGSQAFVPLSGRRYLVAVAPTGDFDPAKLVVFLAQPGQGVNYAKGVWHHYLLPLETESDFLVIDREGPGANLDELELAPTDQVMVRL
jgi:ureidoglycolate lyase